MSFNTLYTYTYCLLQHIVGSRPTSAARPISISTAASSSSSSPNDSSSTATAAINAAKTQAASMILMQPLDADSIASYLLESIQLRAMPLARTIADELQCIISNATETLLSSGSVSSHKQQQLMSSSSLPLLQHHSHSSHRDMKKASNVIDMSDDDSSSSVTTEIIMLREIIARAFLYYSQLRSICSSISSLLSFYNGINSTINQQLSIALGSKVPVIPEFNYKFINKMITNDADEVGDND